MSVSQCIDKVIPPPPPHHPVLRRQNAIYRPGLAMPALVKTTSPTSLNHWESTEAESSCLNSGCECVECESRVADLRKRMRDWYRGWEEEECFEC